MVRKSNYRKIYDVVLQIPRGRVATYGQVARLAGIPDPIIRRAKKIPWKNRLKLTMSRKSPKTDMSHQAVATSSTGRIVAGRKTFHRKI